MKYVKLTIGLIIISLIVSLSVTISKYNTLSEDYSIAVGNEKALLHSNTELRNDIGVLQLTVDQLSYFNDSLLTKLDSVRHVLKIKDEDLQYLQYIYSTIEKKDSVVFIKDTIFVENLHIDTTLISKWYNLNLRLDYPNSVVVAPEIISNQYVVISENKETVKPPKKCIIARWFQKKHKVIKVDIMEENPYIKHKNSKFVKILDK